MAKYEVTHACGHTHTYQLFGKTADRERKMAWLAEQDCPECRKAAEAEAAAKATEGMDLPELTGTPKQVAWANTIRGKFIAQFKEFDFGSFHANEIRYKRINKMVREGGFKFAMEMVSSETEASFWIDCRGGFIENMLTWYAKKLIAAEDAKQAAAKEEAKAEEHAKQEATATAPEPAHAPAKKAVKKSDWGKVAFNLQNIGAQTERAILIKMPHRSEYDGYTVWVSKKLIREGSHSYEYFMSIKADMEFAIKKHAGWSHNNKVLDDKTITAEQMAEAFGGYVEGAGYSRQASIKEDEEVVIEKHVPETLAPVDVEADPELLR